MVRVEVQHPTLQGTLAQTCAVDTTFRHPHKVTDIVFFSEALRIAGIP